MTKQFSIAVLISGGGTTLKNLIEHQAAGKLHAKISMVISSKPEAGGLRFAEQADIDHHVVDHKQHKTDQSFNDAIFKLCRTSNCDLVVCGGFLRLLIVPDDFEKRIINIHPSLIPEFSGKGFYGMKVHKAAIESGTDKSGCTVHWVDSIFDHGEILKQQSVPVLKTDTPETLQKRVFEAECELLPSVINQLADTDTR